MDINNNKVSIKDKYVVKSIDTYLCKDWLLNKHYAKRLCSISYSFGLFQSNNLIGVLTIGKPASNQLCIGVCGNEYSKYVYELNRLVINDGLEKNVLSYFVGNSLKMIPDNMILISYADTKMQHNGYIYQATNWIYTGATKERTDIGLEDNKHSRHYDKSIDYSLRKHRSSKHRYIFFIGKLKKEFINKLNYKIEPYPKGENQRYDASYNPSIQTQLF
jgi:hypothetical protein